MQEPTKASVRRRLGLTGFSMRPVPLERGPSAGERGELLLPGRAVGVWAQPRYRRRPPRRTRWSARGGHLRVMIGFLGVTGLGAAWLLVLVLASR